MILELLFLDITGNTRPQWCRCAVRQASDAESRKTNKYITGQ